MRLVQSRALSAGELPRLRASKFRPAVPARSRAAAVREMVAAVCYRIVATEIEFLLVQTSRGRWTFPKGGVEPGMTRAQAAAMEAVEEAGVLGRVEELWFARYNRRNNDSTDTVTESPVHAHLCLVLRQVPPQERDRNPTWFSAEKAKRRLREERSQTAGDELAQIVDRALARIRRLHLAATNPKEPLRQVRFES
jgi:8-oxo-dGTP pyrophosphatase MutT (NUDIX family)